MLKSKKDLAKIYENRKLADGFPEIEHLGVAQFSAHQTTESRMPEIMRWVDRIKAFPTDRKVVVVGCGPKPQSMKDLLAMGCDAVAVEPVSAYVKTGGEYIEAPDRILEGSAESIPFDDESQDIVLLESVLEHVDSPSICLAEAYRVLRPGGILYVQTTNRFRFSLRGENGEYNVRFFNWFPDIVKESYVHQHLHFEPELANYTSRPAVHWFCYTELCELGREVGFHRFYSKIDLVTTHDPSVSKSPVRRFLTNKIRYNPWLRSLALTQVGDSIFMLKRT